MNTDLVFKTKELEEGYMKLIELQVNFYIIKNKITNEVVCVSVNLEHVDKKCVALNLLNNSYVIEQIIRGTLHE